MEGKELEASEETWYGRSLSGTCRVLFEQRPMPEDVHSYLLSSPVFAAPFDESKAEEWKFDKCIDYPSEPKHVYYEGYFHTIGPGASTLRSLHPRKGMNFDKPSAPKHLKVFIRALQAVNKEWTQQLAVEVRPAGPFGLYLSKLIEKGRLFSDCSVQFHFGAGISGPLLGWHSDACNSALHCAISVRGKRALHSKVYPSNKEDLPATDRVIQIHWQKPGDVYLSNPHCFPHAVEYPESSEEQPVVMAVQARLLITLEEYIEFAQCRKAEETFEIISTYLKSHELKLPSMEDIIQAEKQVEEEDKPWWRKLVPF